MLSPVPLNQALYLMFWLLVLMKQTLNCLKWTHPLSMCILYWALPSLPILSLFLISILLSRLIQADYLVWWRRLNAETTWLFIFPARNLNIGRGRV